jgi:hypothetical protein
LVGAVTSAGKPTDLDFFPLDRTRSARLKHAIEIDYQVGENWQQGLAEDISVKGLRGVFPRPLPEDALVPLRIYLHDRGRIHRFDTNAEIIWKARSRKIRGGLSYGLAFLTMKDMDKAYLRTFISEHLKG